MIQRWMSQGPPDLLNARAASRPTRPGLRQRDQAGVGLDLTAELDLVGTERPTTAQAADPAEVETHQLPHGIQTQAAGHHRVALEMAAEKPQVRSHVELRQHLAAAEAATVIADVRNAVEHQHRRQRQLRVAGPEQLPTRAAQQILIVECVDTLRRGGRFCHSESQG